MLGVATASQRAALAETDIKLYAKTVGLGHVLRSFRCSNCWLFIPTLAARFLRERTAPKARDSAKTRFWTA